MLYIETNEAWKQDKTLVIPVYEDKKLPARLTEALDHDLSNEINAKAGCLSTISTLGRLPMQTICFIGMGFNAHRHAASVIVSSIRCSAPAERTRQ